MAPLLRFQQQRKSGIAADIDPLDRVHLHGDFQAHRFPGRMKGTGTIKLYVKFARPATQQILRFALSHFRTENRIPLFLKMLLVFCPVSS